MASSFPSDWGTLGVGCPRINGSPVQRHHVNIGTWTANQTKTTLGLNFDRAAVVREVWFSADAVPSDVDGTMLLNVLVRDISEGAADTIVASFDSETVIVASLKAYQATLLTESSENELTVEAGDTLYFTAVNNSAAIDTNPSIVVTVVYHTLAAVT